MRHMTEGFAFGAGQSHASAWPPSSSVGMLSSEIIRWVYGVSKANSAYCKGSCTEVATTLAH